MIEEIKILNMAGDIAGAQKLIEEVKDKSMAIADSNMVNGLETKKKTIGQFKEQNYIKR